jgi:hypothetical protein
MTWYDKFHCLECGEIMIGNQNHPYGRVGFCSQTCVCNYNKKRQSQGHPKFLCLGGNTLEEHAAGVCRCYWKE